MNLHLRIAEWGRVVFGGRLRFGLALPLFLVSCVSLGETELPPAIPLHAEAVEWEEARATSYTETLGVRVEENESDSLENLEELPGVRIVDVAFGSAAARVGLRVGDVIVAANGVSTDAPDALEEVLRASTSSAPVEFELRRDLSLFRVQSPAPSVEPSAEPGRLYVADPVRLRAGFRTVLLEADGGTSVRGAAEIAAFFPRSPLPDAGLEVGDRVLSVDDVEVSSADHFVRQLIAPRAYGEKVRLEVRRGDDVRTRRVRLWAPRRVVERFAIPVVCDYSRSVRDDTVDFRFLGLSKLRLFSYHREGGEREYRFLFFIPFRTGYGELVDETPSTEGGA